MDLADKRIDVSTAEGLSQAVVTLVSQAVGLPDERKTYEVICRRERIDRTGCIGLYWAECVASSSLSETLLAERTKVREHRQAWIKQYGQEQTCRAVLNFKWQPRPLLTIQPIHSLRHWTDHGPNRTL